MPGLNNAEVLNGYVADKSYIEGYTPSVADAVVFKAYSAAPDAKFNHALRWFNHIASYTQHERDQFPGTAKDLNAYGPAGAAPAAAEPKKEAAAGGDDEDDFDLFGDDDDDDEVDEAAEKLKQERLAAYEAKKAKKPVVIAKSSILLDIKPWDDETDMKAMEAGVRAISADGLLWGASKLIDVAFGIKKLQILCTVEDDKVGVDFLEEEITALEDYVQSIDIAAFNKI